MKHSFGILVILFFFLALNSLMSCSKSINPVEPEKNESPNIPVVLVEPQSDLANRSILAAYDVTIDPDSETVTMTMSTRAADYHLELRKYYPDVLKIVAEKWIPEFYIDIRLTHPLPGSGIDAYDPRVIAIIPANDGVSFCYPVLDVIANYMAVIEPDGYTKLHDSSAPLLQGNANPFKAYFKNQPNRVWSSVGATSETQRWYINLDALERPLRFKLVVDISTNHPNPPQPVVDNAKEPVEIEALLPQLPMMDPEFEEIEVTVLDWQGSSGIDVKVECPLLFNGAVELDYSRPGPNPNEYVFSGLISNQLLASEGVYNLLIAAGDEATDVYTYSEFSVKVEELAFNPVDLTPPHLNFSPYSVFVHGNYAYTAGGTNGLHIFSLLKLDEPLWVHKVDIPTGAFDVCVVNESAFVVSGETGIVVVDISYPESAFIKKIIDIPDNAKSIFVSDGYAYVSTENDHHTNNMLRIIDIDPLESAYIVKSISLSSSFTKGIHVCNGYAYAAMQGGLQIIDIEPPETAFTVKIVDTTNSASDVDCLNGYAYVTQNYGVLEVIDVDPPESASIIKTVNFSGHGYSVMISNGYAYIASSFGLTVMDADPPESTSIVATLELPGVPEDVYIMGKYAYIANSNCGLEVIDIEPPELPSLVHTNYTPGIALDTDYSNGYAYVANKWAGLQIIDIEPSQTAHVVANIDTPDFAIEVCVNDGYAYVADENSGLLIIDIDPPESAYIVNTVGTSDCLFDVIFFEGYVYGADFESGLQIIDVEPISSAYIVKTVDTPGRALAVCVMHDYAYVADYSSGLQIIDINPIESAQIVKNVAVPYAINDVSSFYGFAMVTDYHFGLLIVDVNPPESAYIVNTINMPPTVYRVEAFNGHAFVNLIYSTTNIVDLIPPESAYVTTSIDFLDQLCGMDMNNNIAYVANGYKGLWIVELW